MRIKRILKRALKISLILDCWVIALNFNGLLGYSSISEMPLILLLLWYALICVPVLAFLYYILKELS